MATSVKKGGSNVANILSPVYPEMGGFKGRGHKPVKGPHMSWKSGRKGSSR